MGAKHPQVQQPLNTQTLKSQGQAALSVQLIERLGDARASSGPLGLLWGRGLGRAGLGRVKPMESQRGGSQHTEILDRSPEAGM